MTLEAALPQSSLPQVPRDPRLQLAELFRKPSPSVTVIVKKRRIATCLESAVVCPREGAAAVGHQSAHETGARGPRVHRTAKPLSDELVQSGTAQPAVSPELASPRRRRVRDPLRRPGEVRIVVQTPAAPQVEHDDSPAWQRLLSRPAEEVTYQQVQSALEDLQATVLEARLASKTRIL